MRRRQVAVCKTAELSPDTGKVFPLGENGGECLVMYHGGRYYAVGSLCPHQNAPLDGATATDNQVICRRHGYRYELSTGECRTLAGYGLPVYQVEVQNDEVYVSYWDFD